MQAETILADVRAACASVADPEYGLSIEELGLIYDVTVVDRAVVVIMTLTSRYCPAGDVITGAVRAAVANAPGVASVEVRVVWDPGWTPEMVSPRGRRELGWA
jgi:metal-sulfur cluster biosynthetic enzyme